MKLLLVSDEESGYIWDHFTPAAFAGVEMAISCGDLKREYLSFIVTMLPIPLFYVPGNHDASFLENPPDGAESLDERIIECGGLRIGGLGGCLGCNPRSPFEYTEASMKKRVQRLERQVKRHGGIDIFVTHAPALGLGDGNDQFHRGFQCFADFLAKHKPKLHVFGHQHKRYAPTQKTPESYGETMLINACGYHIFEYL